ncbi:hypothetical protein, partial [Weissella cibaria]|uniref:hypothetical protein n=1 Tax=Weissella cibaria TaxID=137591 RepID=UPI002A76456F
LSRVFLDILVAAGMSFLFLHQKKVPTTNRANEWSSVPNILEPKKTQEYLFLGLFLSDKC